MHAPPGGNGGRGGGLLTYRQFMLRLPEDVTPAEAERQYNHYRQSHAKLVRQEYFREHSHEEWLHAQFHPSCFEVGAPHPGVLVDESAPTAPHCL
jgi:hypothetical protein